MTTSIKDTITKLRAITPTLNEATDTAADTVAQIDNFLAELSIGLRFHAAPFFERTIFNPDSDVPYCEVCRLAYGRINGIYRLHIEKVIYADSKKKLGVSTETLAWKDAPRDWKLASFVSLPSLLEGIATEAEGMAEATRKTVTIIKQLADALGLDLSGKGTDDSKKPKSTSGVSRARSRPGGRTKP